MSCCQSCSCKRERVASVEIWTFVYLLCEGNQWCYNPKLAALLTSCDSSALNLNDELWCSCEIKIHHLSCHRRFIKTPLVCRHLCKTHSWVQTISSGLNQSRYCLLQDGTQNMSPCTFTEVIAESSWNGFNSTSLQSWFTHSDFAQQSPVGQFHRPLSN